MYAIVISMICVMLLLAGCGNKVDDAVAQTYISKAEKIVQHINNSEFEQITEQFDETMKANLTAEQLSEITPILTASGEFKSIKKQSVEEKDGYKVVVLVAEYSKENRIFTITYNDSEQIAGFFVQ